MTILIKAVQRVNPQDPDGPKKWYPVQQTTKMVSTMELSEDLADETTLNPGEAYMVLKKLNKVVARHLKNGNSVQLGEVGSLYASLETEGAATKEELTARNIKRVNANFLQSDTLKAELQKADFVWLEKLMEEKPTTPGEEPTDPGEEEEPDGPVVQ